MGGVKIAIPKVIIVRTTVAIALYNPSRMAFFWFSMNFPPNEYFLRESITAHRPGTTP
jgi:hypothetical protein